MMLLFKSLLKGYQKRKEKVKFFVFFILQVGGLP